MGDNLESEASGRPRTVRVLAYNIWGLKYIAKHRIERCSEIGDRIARMNPTPDIVGLQECFTQRDFNLIKDRTAKILPHAKFFWSGVFGGGLAIFSKWPIVGTSMFRYSLNGRPTAFFRGDWFVGKGVACAEIRAGPGKLDVIEVFCTHLHAPYEREPNDSYLCHRTAQAWEIAKLMRGAAERGHLVIGLGDFNMVPLSLAHRLITAHAPVVDTWRCKYPESSIGAAVDTAEQSRGLAIPSASFNLQFNGATCDSALNTWRWSKSQQKELARGKNVDLPDTVSDPYAKRLDYIFVGDGRSHLIEQLGISKHQDIEEWRLSSVKVGMIERHPSLGCSLSDHFSVEAALTLSAPASESQTSSSDQQGSTKKSLSTTDSEKMNSISIFPEKKELLKIEFYDQILDMIFVYTNRQKYQRRLRLGHLVIQGFIAIGCLVAVWFSPHNYVSFILMMISCLGLSFGVTDGLIGGLFIGSEMRALREFEWEIRNARFQAEEKSRRVHSDARDSQ